ncbi:MAG: sigma 54-interacting transcriptional regulator [Gammaproteobacteria bacterium]|nr:MAG: sigma 54-interacting transcriptional regulator [Gammaproteobacteria bacterium]
MPARQALTSYLLTLRRLTGADTVSLVLCSSSGQRPCLILHEGLSAPVPELETEALAAEFATQMVQQQQGKQPPGSARPLRMQPSSDDGGYLIGLDVGRIRAALAEGRVQTLPNKRRRSAGLTPESGEQAVVCIGLRYDGKPPPSFVADAFERLDGFSVETPAGSDDWIAWHLALGGYMAWEAYQLSALQRDPVSQLPGRAEFQIYLEREHDRARRDRLPLALLLVNPDEFGLTNHRLGRETGDTALRQVATQLSANLRRSDGTFRYGGAVFGIVMPDTTLAAAQTAAEKLRQALTRHGYLDGAARFTFSTGVAVYEPGEESEPLDDPAELLRRADQALNVAKLAGGARTVVWTPDGTDSGVGTLDRLSGIFTADTEKDYRNMLLLWDTITVISARPETESIAAEFVGRVGSTFRPEWVALYSGSQQDPPRLLAANCANADGEGRISDQREVSLSDQQKQLLAMARKHRRTERLRLEPGRGGGGAAARKAYTAYAVPLLAQDDCLACLYLHGPEETLALDNSDLVFLNALASQIAVALDRAELAVRWRQEKERESQRLREEVNELRQAMQHTRLVYQSRQMDTVVKTLRKVAPTDVTVLITGESGTGKEMLARTVHDLSARRKRPFVTVDCGAIAHSLMDAELFGHVKGAYTGAQGSSPGRIIEAEGGTLFLDEIGEIPLEIQTKLLRFLQEKEITPVGATRPVNVDVRIVSATNRNLAIEVAKGRFRADLYYRLQVVTAKAPALRERPDDIMPLAHYFLERFSSEYGKSLRSLNTAAEQALVDYPWPGNVRELQHRILQAVVMSDGDLIDAAELQLPDAVCVDSAGIPDRQQLNGVTAPLPLTEQGTDNRESAPAPGPVKGNPWAALRDALKQQVTRALEHGGQPVPLGRWLAEDLVLAADNASKGTARHASTALGMAETTFRRRLDKVKRELQAGLMARTEGWSAVQPILPRLVTNGAASANKNILDHARQILLEEVAARVQQDNTLGSALMGVTAPTYRRWTTP